MSSYLSNLLTQTTSKYNSLRRTLLSSEEDGDTEDDTHICRVLRAYYTEKGRPFPQWLPPDPNDRRTIPPQPYAQQQSGYLTSAGGRSQYGAPQNAGGGGAQRASLNDLWDPPGATGSSAQSNGPPSLRGARRPVNAAPPPSSSQLASSSNLGPPPQARPLPSQRAGSYQSVSSTSSQPDRRGGGGGGGRGGGGFAPPAQPSPPSTSSGATAGSAQERLKARLWGGGRGAGVAGSGAGVAGIPPANNPGLGGMDGGGRNPADGGGSGYRYGR